jgi:hypothetical protein
MRTSGSLSITAKKSEEEKPSGEMDQHPKTPHIISIKFITSNQMLIPGC